MAKPNACPRGGVGRIGWFEDGWVMAEFVSNCPRCGAEHITLDCYSSIWSDVHYSWQNWLEIFTVCRKCHRSSIQLVSQIDSGDAFRELCRSNNKLVGYKGSLNDIVKFERFITLRDNHSFSAPDHLPNNIKLVVEEANSCLASQCFNAAGAMYRLALDLATKDLLPEGDEPNAKTRRSLGLRVPWLFDNRKIPVDLKPLAECLQQDGNDGAHDGTLGREDAEDLQDFCFELLRRLFTEPERLKQAEQRRAARREAKEG